MSPASDSPTPDVSLREKAERNWVVWSAVHQVWWCSKRSGYSANLMDAGLYTVEEARRIERVRGVPGSEEAMTLDEALANQHAKFGRNDGASVLDFVRSALSRVERAEAELRDIDATIGNPLALDRHMTRTQKIAHMLRVLVSVNAPAKPIPLPLETRHAV